MATKISFELDGKPFMAIDTPGLRRRRSMATDVEYYSSHRAQRSSANCCSRSYCSTRRAH